MPTSTADPSAPPTPSLYWEDFSVGQVREFDPQPFHLDDDAAERSLFGRLAASGWHTCAMAMRMMCDGYLRDAASLGSPGLESILWAHPVYPGDTLHLRLTVLETRALASRPTVGIVR